jgi:hypothetical protein
MPRGQSNGWNDQDINHDKEDGPANGAETYNQSPSQDPHSLFSFF